MSRNSLFQVSLLLVLATIALGIWFNRFSPPKPTTNSGIFDDSRFLQGQAVPNTPVPNAPVPNTPGNAAQVKKNGNPQDLLEAIQRGEEHTIRLAWSEALRVRDTKFLVGAYRLACKHGGMKALVSMNTMSLPHSQEDEQQIYAGMNDLLDRQQYDAVRYIMTHNNGFGLTRNALNAWIGDQFVREPWDRQRMEAVLQRALHFQGTNELLVRMITASLNGPEDRFDWMCQNLHQVPDSSPLIVMDMLAKAKVINASNVKRMMHLSVQWDNRLDKSALFDACLPFLTAEHATDVRNSMMMSQHTEKLINYILEHDAGSISSWATGNPKFDLALRTQFTKAIMSEQGTQSLQRFASIKDFLIRECQQTPRWEAYAREHIPFTASVLWLWSHGFRPPENASLALRLYLPIRCQDHQYLETVLYREKRALPVVLNEGFSLRDISVVKDNDEQRIVPLLAAIEYADLKMVQLLIETKRHNWRTWAFENPLSVALRTNKSDIYRYLVSAGVTEDTGQRGPTNQQKSKDAPAAAVAFDRREMRTIETAGKFIVRVVEAGDLAVLEKVLANFPFRTPIASSSQDPQRQLEAYEQSTQTWRNNAHVREAFEKSVKHPQLFARLLAEGFVIDLPILMAIVRDGHDEVLKLALCDMPTRRLASKNLAQLDEAAQVWPKVLRVLTESGVGSE